MQKWVLILFISACAQPQQAESCGAQCSDAGVRSGDSDLGLAEDLSPLAPFGSPCTDRSQCESNICVFSGLSGVCSERCPAGGCPSGFGCYSVVGVSIDPGEVLDICVPENNQLCSPCTKDSECSAAAKDLCLPGPVGDSFCARDCEKVACPSGYDCKTLTVSGQTVKQCVPTSGACDCATVQMSGQKVACSLSTPFGVCQGARSCDTVSGWSACAPPAASDMPDDTFADQNCDGIDGDYHDGIFVAIAGVDGSGCGKTHTMPCRTLSRGVVRAIEDNVRNVYVQAGNYDEVVVLQAGKNIYGGYDANWQRDDRNVAGHAVVVTGLYDGQESQFLTVRAHNLPVPAVLDNLILVGPNVPDANVGSSSYAVHVQDAQLRFNRVTVRAGNGAAGRLGATGADAGLVAASSTMSGKVGGNGDQGFSSCDDSTHGAAGKAGTNTCPDGRSPSPGHGGVGGTPDDNCTCFGVCICTGNDCDATAGAAGTAAAIVVGLAGAAGKGGLGHRTCDAPGVGGDGAVQNGAGGSKGHGAGVLTNGYWYGAGGGSGANGDNGTGGGGAGGAGGCDKGTTFENSSGAGGGGGGAGGCRALSGGTGGGAGGGSFGVFAVASTVTLTACEVQRGNGGEGGGGGSGGRGQSGGPGGEGGLAKGTSAAGGVGGNGGHGGHSGGGGGGAGGLSYGIYSSGSTITQSCTFSGGKPGGGGAGGPSAPSAPLGERDGIPGESGDPGALGDVGVCASPSGC